MLSDRGISYIRKLPLIAVSIERSPIMMSFDLVVLFVVFGDVVVDDEDG